MHPLEKFEYCPRCGSHHFVENGARSRKCENCGFEYFMNPSAANVAIIRNSKGEILITLRKQEPAKGTLDLPGGFTEIGETSEEGVVREVMEETQLRIKNLRYFKSQPWPYPCGLMVGFFAEYESGELKLQDDELSRGGWFNKHSLPTIPEKLSLARMLIDDWLERNK